MCCKASLIDIDLQVMRQLLMLNDQVEEMKWQRRQQLLQRNALLSSACYTPGLDEPDYSDTDQRWSRSVGHTPDSWSLLDRRSRNDEDDDEEATLKYPTPSTLSLFGGGTIQDDRFSDSGSVDALDRPNPDTPEVFPATPQTRTAVARTSPAKKPSATSSGKGEAVGLKLKKMSETTEQRSSTCDIDQKSPRSPTKTKEQDVHSTNANSFQDLYTYVEMLI